MLQITTHTSDNLAPGVAELCAELLCKPGSEMQQVFQSIAALDYDEPLDVNLRIAVAMRTQGDDNVPIGWAAISLWNGAPSIQAFVFPNYRQRGLASALVSALTVEGDIPLDVANVFSHHFASVALRAGFRSTNLWKREEDGWVRT